MRAGLLVACAVVLQPHLGLQGADITPRSYPVPDHGELQLQVPAAWKGEIHPSPGDLPPTIEITPPEGDDFDIQITPLWSPTGDPEFNRPEMMRPLILEIGDKQLPQSVETEISLKELHGPAVTGYYFSVTDRAPQPGDWKNLTAGTAALDDLMLSFTILTNRLDGDDLKSALKMIEGCRKIAPASAPASSPSASPPAPGSTAAPAPAGARKLTPPGKTWSLVLDLPGFDVEPPSTLPDTAGVRWAGRNPATGVELVVRLEKADPPGDAKACRERHWNKRKKQAPTPKQVRLDERPDMALVAYMLPRDGEGGIDRRHVEACLSHDGVWVDIDLSKERFAPQDQKLFDAVLDSLRYEDAPVTPP